MNWVYNSNNEPLTYLIKVYAAKPMRVRIVVEELISKNPIRVRPNTQYTNRACDINKGDKFYIRMPLSPEWSVISVYNEKTGNTKSDPNLKVEFEKLELKKKINDIHRARPEVREFIKFAEWFSKKAGYLSSGRSVYLSPDNRFRIEYVDSILDENGRALLTPARIGADDGIIEINAVQFRKFSVPRRMAVLLHEFAHVYINTHPEKEIEADLNALLIYLGLGYPRIEAFYTFTRVFARSGNQYNKAEYLKRYKMIEEFIETFDKRFENMHLNYY